MGKDFGKFNNDQTIEMKMSFNKDVWVTISQVVDSCDMKGFFEETSVMEIKNIGCLVRVTHHQGIALTFVPNVKIGQDKHGNKKLIALYI